MTTYLDQLSVIECEILLLLENHGLGITGATVSADSEAAGGNMGAANLLSPALDVAYRSGSLATEQKRGTITVRYDLGRARPVDSVALAASNVRVPWGIDLYRQNPGTSSPDFSSPWTDPIVRGRMRDYSWREMPWTLGPSAENLTLWTAQSRLRSLIQADQTYYAIRYVDIRFDISDADQGLRFQGDYLEFGSAFISQAFHPKVNLLLDWEMGIDDTSQTHRSEGGALLGRHRAKLGTLAFVLGYVERYEAFRKVFSDWMRKHGTLGRVFAWAEPDQPAYFYDQSMVCTAETLPKIAMANLDWPAAKGWSLKETE